MTGAISAAAARFEAASVLFGARPTRLSLANLAVPSAPRRTVTVRIHRNHAVEPVLALAEPYLAFARIDARFELGGYDDTLSFAGHRDAPADVELVYLDVDRIDRAMSPEAFEGWLVSRLRSLRSASAAPIVVVGFGVERSIATHRAAIEATVDVFLLDVRSVPGAESTPHRDERALGLSGTRVASGLQVLLARELACGVLPALLLPPIKAVAIDLDGTLVRGVLGEDGVAGVELTDGHRRLQQSLRDLRTAGVFVALVSRNVEADVEALFCERDDLPLQWDDFSSRRISWGRKSDAIDAVAQDLRIAPDAVLFVDDNPGEVFEVLESRPDAHVLLASHDGDQTRRSIEQYPGIRKLRRGADDALRIRDLEVTKLRDEVARSRTDLEDYHRELEVTITRRYDARDDLDRVAELGRKTNQFNLALSRANGIEIERRIEDPASVVVSVELTDRLSPSGVVAIALGTRSGDRLLVDELCVSCRALGRGLEDSLVLASLIEAPIARGCTELVFRVAHGDRNQPALRWLGAHLGIDGTPAPGLHTLSIAPLARHGRADGVRFIDG